MSAGLALLVGAGAGVIVGHLAVRYDLPAWLCHIYARAFGATWFTPALSCPSCGRRVHLMRSRPDRAGIFGIADGGGRCLSCSSTSPRNAPQDAPGRTESAGQVGLGVLGWPGAHAGAQGPRCICGPDSTGEAPDERPDCPLHGPDVPYDPNSDTGEVPF